MQHVVLLGDSIFDNAAYVRGAPDVIRQLRQLLPSGSTATLKAIDGSVTRDIRRQLAGIPSDATHLVVSIGGNDALRHTNILNTAARSSAEVLSRIADIADEFQRDYRQMLQTVLSLHLPTALCTIYYPRFPDPFLQRLAVTALSIFNDCIIREAFTHRLPLIDLRLVCDEDTDYANPIEPSERGGQKIASAIRNLLAHHDFARPTTEVFIR
ncbi:MAG TPA: SGNH/GDSL hydrolase family protein [Pyrinomonadaceae bacterium]|jgi:lysophospholipase L1-like esterase